jgi:hypothetical protein
MGSRVYFLVGLLAFMFTAVLIPPRQVIMYRTLEVLGYLFIMTAKDACIFLYHP